MHQRPNQSVELTATRRAFTFKMIKIVSVEVALVLGGGRSAYSRYASQVEEAPP